MLANSTHNNILLISPTTTNQWPQPQNHIDEKPNTLVMEKSQPHQQHQQQPPPPPPHQQVLKCPRCDSSNTKFCYYNNYSLSQPRHFCKACKRYWTRGGTLRNVPVGGGCRKNKRVKRAPSSAVAAAGPGIEGGCSNNNLNPNPNSSSQNPQIEISISSPHHQISPFFFGSEMNNLNPFHGRFNSGYDLNGLGLGFSSTTSGSSMLSNYSIFGSSLQQLHQNQNQSKLMSMKDAVHQNYHGSGGALTAFEELQLSGNNNNNSESAGICTSTTVKGSVKVELQQDHHQQNRFDWNNINNNNQIEQIGYSSLDPTLYWNPNTSNSTSVGSLWHDNPNSNIGSSLTSLI